MCQRGSNAKLASGVFVHAEQAQVALEEGAYEAWVKALREAFNVIRES